MIKQITFLALLIGWNWGCLAQGTTEPAAELIITPPALAPVAAIPAATDASTVMLKRKISFGLSAGTQFNSIFGTSTFLEPRVIFPVTNRFSGFASLSYVNNFGINSRFLGSETPGTNWAPASNQRYILNAGGNYMVNERLNLTGQVWRDLSKNPLPASLNVFNPGSTSGLLMRANYKVTEHLSVSGGLRFSNGHSYNNTWYNPALPFGF